LVIGVVSDKGAETMIQVGSKVKFVGEPEVLTVIDVYDGLLDCECEEPRSIAYEGVPVTSFEEVEDIATTPTIPVDECICGPRRRRPRPNCWATRHAFEV
jgi:hypothetical protein